MHRGFAVLLVLLAGSGLTDSGLAETGFAESGAAGSGPVESRPAGPAPIRPASGLRVIDRPLDAGLALRIQFGRSADDPLGRGRVERYELFRRGPGDTGFVSIASFPSTSAGEEFSQEDGGLERGKDYSYRVRAVSRDGSVAETPVVGPVQPRRQWFFTNKINTLVATILFVALVLGYIRAARQGKSLFVRRIPGLDAIDEAVGRSTEMGRATLYIPGIGTIADVATIASLNILGQVARRVASYQSRIVVPNRDPIVFPVTQDVVRQGFLEAGYPEDYRDDDVYFVTNDQFSYAAATCGTMVREKPGATMLLGMFYAEALVLAETGSSIGAIQIAGTDAISQLPFFVTTCDYTIIGEELYAASAYISREPTLLGSLKGQDAFKLIVIVLIVAGALAMTAGVLLRGEPYDWISWILRVRGTGG
jgi:hypothetical protein